MQVISDLLKVTIMGKNHVLRMQCGNIGAKTTFNFQPMDVGKFFRCIESKTRLTSTQENDCPLRKLMTASLDKLNSEGRLILAKMKNNIYHRLCCFMAQGL